MYIQLSVACTFIAMAIIFAIGVALCHYLDKEYARENSAERDIAVMWRGYKMLLIRIKGATCFLVFTFKSVFSDDEGDRWYEGDT